jgi:hypothetical protein
MTETVLSHADGDPGAYETLVLGIGNVLWACTRATRSLKTSA